MSRTHSIIYVYIGIYSIVEGIIIVYSFATDYKRFETSRMNQSNRRFLLLINNIVLLVRNISTVVIVEYVAC